MHSCCQQLIATAAGILLFTSELRLSSVVRLGCLVLKRAHRETNGATVAAYCRKRELEQLASSS
jgi:hypothetical protein